MVIWLIGMSGAGKTTLAAGLYARLKSGLPNLMLLDGDAFREVFGNDVDHTVDGRRRNAERISHLCAILDRQNIHVIAAVLSIFPEWQEWNRRHFSRYFEIFLDVPIDQLQERDPKGIYAAAARGEMPNVVGLDIPFPPPARPDLVIGADMQRSGVDACVGNILERLPELDPAR